MTTIELPQLYELGTDTAAVNSEVKCLLLGFAALGQTDLTTLHSLMIERGAASYYSFAPNHTNDSIRSTHPSILEVNKTSGEIIIGERALTVAGLGGLLLRDYSTSPITNGGINKIMGASKIIEGQTVLPPTSTRIMFLRWFTASPRSGLSVEYLADAAKLFGLSKKSTNAQINSLRKNGIIENLEGKTAILRFTEQGKKHSAKYLDIIDRYTNDTDQAKTEGLNYLDQLTEKPDLVGLLVRKSMKESGRNESPILESLNQRLLELAEITRPLTTEQIATHLGLPIESTGVALGRLSKNYGPKANIVLLPQKASKGRRLWQVSPAGNRIALS